MTVLYSILSGIIGAILGLFPLSLGGHFVFFIKVNTTVQGTSSFSIGNDTVFLVYFGILCALFLLYHEKIINLLKMIFDKSYINESDSGILKELGICLAFYIPAVLCNVFFENAGFSNILLCIFICVNTVVIYFSDYIEKSELSEKNALYVTAVGAMLGGITGFSEISAVFLAGLLSGKKANSAIRFAFLLYIPVLLIKSVVYLVKACISGFTVNFGCGLLIFIFSFIASFFAAGIVKKAAVKRNFRLFAYYTTLFAVVVIYTFIKG